MNTTKVNNLRHNEYYGLQDTFDNLYKESNEGKVFDNLMEVIASHQNILLAYRNIKSNIGSNTPGTDKLTIKSIGKLPPDKMVDKVRRILKNYQPKPVRRKEIPKPNGKTRPLGIPCIWDRLIQQCILQVLEPICEAKFSDKSHGFRPNRSCETAIARTYQYIQRQGLHYAIEFDIKGFFDNVNHSKLIKQIWAMGIRDKHLLYIIRKILRAPIRMPDNSLIRPDKGTPQGGILSPLLSNIVLHELDKWIESQWVKNPIRLKYSISYAENGTINYTAGYKAMRKTNLKEMYIVRYADDFRIFCRTRTAAVKTKIATEMWLKERLKLETSPEKTRIVNLKRQYSEFLGFKIKVRNKGKKKVVKSHMSDKAIRNATLKLKQQVKNMQRPKDEKHEYQELQKFNAMVLGLHNYYRIATNINLDFSIIGRQVAIVTKNRLKGRLSKIGNKVLNNAITKRYGKSKQMQYLHGYPMAVVSYVQTKNPMHKKKSINKYTPEGRREIHNKLQTDPSVFQYLMLSPITGQSLEYADNRISLYSAQKGRCAITKELMDCDDIHCHHILPKKLGGTDKYQNLVLVSKTVHQLIHATLPETIDRHLKSLNLDDKQIKKLNKFRSKAQLTTI